MLTTIFDADGKPLDAKVDVEDNAVTVHSRGGAFGKPNLRNPDYRKALRVILERLAAGNATLTGVWLDSSVAKKWPENDRLLLEATELSLPVDQLVTLIGQRGAAKGRPVGKEKGHGNSTKRVRIVSSGLPAKKLMKILNPVTGAVSSRLPAELLGRVQPWMIDNAIVSLRSGVQHSFPASTEYDVLLPNGERVSANAIFGIALKEVIGRPATPSDFSGGMGTPCFEIIEYAGYPIVAKDDEPSSRSQLDDERFWAEGSLVRVEHLRRERAPGLAKMKKRHFIKEHGHLFCQRCGLIPSKSLGPQGDACIEVHHDVVAVSKMVGETHTRLADLKCLCANCHRIVHREIM
ncbi:HNH endonuclease [Agrobacterium vaccinii]|uniref:HNH endonuclease n=1 Tax=Agrobacterium vaccinii TaxID=2735528 RepID=UPI001E62F1A2|nr:hypothetical protein [Agrobacterium vaccinii]UHS55500.1 hypothetical protein HRS00_01020 [Agrobacterium vaccinii]